jgi:hypothetical protein
LPDNDDLKKKSETPSLDVQEDWMDLNITGAIPSYLQEEKPPVEDVITGDMPALQVDPNATTSVPAMEAELDPNATTTVPAMEAELDPNATTTVPAMEAEIDPNATTSVPAMEAELDPNATTTVPAMEAEIDPNATTEVPSLLSRGRKALPGAAPVQEIPDENDPDSALTDEQRELLKMVSQLRDTDSFEEANEKLGDEPEMLLSEQKLELLESVAVDAGPFVAPELAPILNDETSLTEDQKELLEEVSKLADAETFNEEVGVLKEDGQVISEEERWLLEQNKMLLSPEEQKQEFLNDDADLAGTRSQEIVFKPFVENQRLSEVADSEFTDLDAIPAPNVIPADYAPLVAMPEDSPGPVREAKDGIIGRPVDGPAKGGIGVARTVRKHIASEKVIVPFVLVMLSLGLFLLPGYLRKQLSGEEDEALAAQQLELTMAQEMEDQIPDASQDPQVTRNASGNQGSSSGGFGGTSYVTIDSPGEMAATEGPLSDARKLASKGYTKRSRELYLMYLSSNPRAISVRIELIKMLIGAKENMLARVECIDALKLKPTLEQMQEIAALYQRVQLD